MAETDFERTEEPTPRRREEARQEGNVARSADLSAAVMILAAVLLLRTLGLKVLTSLKLNMQLTLSGRLTPHPTRPDDIGTLFFQSLHLAAQAAVPLVLAMTAVAVAATAGQVGFHISTRPLQPDLSRLSPWRGLQHLIDARGRMRLLMSLGKVLLVFGLAAWLIWRDLPRIVILAQLESVHAFSAACELVYSLALKLAAVLLVLGILDYAFQYWQRERDLRMTKAELKEELKRMEGDPLVKQRRSRIARQLAMQRISAAVPRAQVVVTNPTHYAVALAYDARTMRAPKVVAKGADYLAQYIRQLAALHGVPIVERKELAQALYRSVDVGQEIPPQFYNAVAEVLAYVYRLSGRKIA